MMWRRTTLSAGSIVLAALLWVYSPVALDWIGLEDFDPLDRICLIFLILSLAESVTMRWSNH